MGRAKKSKAARSRGGQKKAAAAPEVTPPQGWLAPLAALLVLAGLATSVYLGHLYLYGDESSFCNINSTWDCLGVAKSKYSKFLGVPVALWGIEFFLACAALLVLPRLGLLPLQRWDSLLFDAALIGLPICGLLAWISATRINKACLMCVTVYGVVVLMFLAAGLAGLTRPVGGARDGVGARLAGLLLAGPRELLGLLATAKGGTALTFVAVLALSQLIWVPRLLKAESGPKASFKGQVTAGLTIGPASAKIQIDEFTDFQCPHCSRGHQVMMQLLQRFRGKIRMQHRDFPLDSSCNSAIPIRKHPFACMAAIYARCAGQQDKYWAYEELLFVNQELLNEDTLKHLAQKVGIDATKLQACVANPATKAQVVADVEEGLRRKITGTPTFYVNGEAISGVRPIAWWENKINTLLKQ